MNKILSFCFAPSVVTVLMLVYLIMPAAYLHAAVDCSDDTTTEVPQLECEALVALYDSTGGLAWQYNSYWNTESSVSTWYGVTVTQGHVTALALSSNDLVGDIPSEISSLSYLGRLGLEHNDISSIPSEIGDLTNLYSLSLTDNSLTTIPSEIGNLVNLKNLLITTNQLTEVPSEIANLTELTWLDISYNDLSTFPFAICSLTNLKTLKASQIQLGSLPTEISNLTNLTTLEIDDNELSSIPDEFVNLINLTSLNIGYNYLWLTDFNSELSTFLTSKDPDWESTQQYSLDTTSRLYSYGNPAITGSGSALFQNVDVAKGSYHVSKVDMMIPGKGPSFTFRRAYNSLHKSPWTFGYEMRAEYVFTNKRKVSIGPREDGHMQYFYKDTADPAGWHAINPGDFEQLVEEDDGSFTLYTQGNKVYTFAAPEGDHEGRLETISDRLDNSLTFTYDTSNNLIGAIDANNRVYTIARDTSNRISSVTDFAGRYVAYTYDENDMLTMVRKMRGDDFYDRYTYHETSPTFLASISNAMVDYLDLSDSLSLGGIDDISEDLPNQIEIEYTEDPITSDLYRVYTVTTIDGQTEFLYGYSEKWGGAYTGISRPQVDSLNSNLVYILDAGRIVKKYDQKSAEDELSDDDIVTTKTYKEAADSSSLSDLALVTQKTDPNYNDSFTEYNDSIGGGRVSQLKNALGENNEVNYNTSEIGVNVRPVTSIVQSSAGANQEDITTQYQNFTLTGQARTVIDPEGYTTTRSFDESTGLITESIDARNNGTTYTYDARENITQTTKAYSGGDITTTRTYFDDTDLVSPGRLESETSPLGLVTTYTYDEHGNILSRNESKADDNINYTTYYDYDASDNVVWIMDPNGNVSLYSYDTLNRKTEEQYVVTLDGEEELLTKSSTYDALGRLASVTNELGQSSYTHYTGRGQVKYRVNPLSQTTISYTYDANGNVETVTDGEGRVVRTRYDDLNRKISVENDHGDQQFWEYNTAGQVASYTDARGNSTYYEYDNVGNLTQVTDAENNSTESTYDGNRNLLTVTDPNGQTTTYGYDELNRRISLTLNNSTDQSTYSYDANGNVVIETTPTGEGITKTYDALNRVTQITELTANNSITRQISYTYDANNNVLTASSVGNTISYTYDELDRITGVTDQNNQTITYGYDEAGNKTSLTYPGDKTVSYSYDDADRLESLTDWFNNITSYSRNDARQLLQVTYGNGTKTKYGYDSVGRLDKIENLKSDDSVISQHDMTFDEVGNITELNNYLPLDPTLPTGINLLTYDDKNRILSADSRSFTHDDTGRIVEEDADGTQTIYNFDIKDHITNISQDDSILYSYSYDLNNNRISFTDNGVETRYVIDPLAHLPNVIAETDSQGNVSTYYIYGEGLVSQISTTGDIYYYHFDQTGNTLALTDNNGDVTDSYAYTPYGKTTRDGTAHNPFLYVGKHGVMDDGNGLHYMRARYYKEDIKRFMSLDALHGEMKSPQSLNRYAYVQGNPVMGIDPSGLYDESANLLDPYVGEMYDYALEKLGDAVTNDLYSKITKPIGMAAYAKTIVDILAEGGKAYMAEWNRELIQLDDNLDQIANNYYYSLKDLIEECFEISGYLAKGTKKQKFYLQQYAYYKIKEYSGPGTIDTHGAIGRKSIYVDGWFSSPHYKYEYFVKQ